ncbi:MAG: chemotaxis protein CheW [Magnetospirillum sp.]|nr:chemotaxis protein CheW [Magnetospirillum sp.]
MSGGRQDKDARGDPDGGGASSLLERLERLASAAAADQSAFAAAVLDLRARRLAAARANTEDLPAGVAVLGFRVAGENYALPLSDLAEVLPLGPWAPVPGVSQSLLGVVNVRGEIRPVMNLHAILSLPEPEPPAGGYVVFLRHRTRAAEFRDVGVRADALDRISVVRDDDLTLPHAAANGLPQRFIAGITPDTLILLDSRQLLALDVLQDRRAAARAAL